METRLLIRGEQVAGEGARARRREPGHGGDRRRGRRGLARAARRRDRGRARGGARLGGHPRCRARRAAARGGQPDARADRRPRPGADARGRQAADRELRRGRLDGRRVRLLRGDGPQLRRARDPLDRGDPAGARRQGADRRVGRDRPLELPAAAALLEARAGAGGRQHGGREAVRADSGVDADACRVLRGPAGGSREPGRRRAATWAPPWSRTSASTAWPSPGRWRPARRSPSPAPSA